MWWSSNVLLAVAAVAMLHSFVREYSVRRYLDGFSDAIVPNSLPAEQKVRSHFELDAAESLRGPTLQIRRRWTGKARPGDDAHLTGNC